MFSAIYCFIYFTLQNILKNGKNNLKIKNRIKIAKTKYKKFITLQTTYLYEINEK